MNGNQIYLKACKSIAAISKEKGYVTLKDVHDELRTCPPLPYKTIYDFPIVANRDGYIRCIEDRLVMLQKAFLGFDTIALRLMNNGDLERMADAACMLLAMLTYAMNIAPKSDQTEDINKYEMKYVNDDINLTFSINEEELNNEE